MHLVTRVVALSLGVVALLLAALGGYITASAPAADKAEIFLQGGHTDSVRSVAYAPDGESLATGGADNTIRLWDPASGNVRATLTGHTDSVRSVAYSPDGKGLATGSGDKTIRLWDLASGSVRATLTGHTGSVLSVAYSPDGKRLAAASADNTIKLWDLASGSVLATLTGHTDSVWSVAYSPDGKSLATGSSDNTIKLWDLASGSVRATLTGHTGSVSSVAYSPDGKSLGSGSADNTIKLWDLASGSVRATLTGHMASVSSVAYSPDGRSLASTGWDGTARYWNLETQREEMTLALGVGDQFLVLYPGSLRYRSSRQPGEIEPAAVRFHGTVDNAYPLHYYREPLLIGREETTRDAMRASVSVAPMPIRLAWDQLNNKPAWLAGALALYASLLIAIWALWRRSDSLEIAKDFLREALGHRVTADGRAAFRMNTASGQIHAVLFNPARDADREVFRNANGRLYLVYRDQAPSAEQLATLRQRAPQAQLVPLSSRDLARAIAAGSASVETLRRLEEPFVARNDPYDEQRPVESELMFFGRGKVLDDIPQSLLQGQHVGLFGLRKVGKTSLLNRVRDRLSDHPCIWIDCQGYEAVAVDLFNAVLGGLDKELTRLSTRVAVAIPAVENANQFRVAFLKGLEALRAKTPSARVILLLDEVDKYFPNRGQPQSEQTLREYVAFFRMLRALAQEHRGLAVMAVAYRPDVNRSNQLTDAAGENPMFMAYQEHFLGFLEAEDTATMLRELGRWQSIEWDEDALVHAHEASGGHPLMARQLASDTCERGRRKQVSITDLREAVKTVRDGFARHRIGRYIEESIWAMLRREERAVLVRVATQPGIAASLFQRDLAGALVNLVQFGVVDERLGGLRVRGSLLQAWIERNGMPE